MSQQHHGCGCNMDTCKLVAVFWGLFLMDLVFCCGLFGRFLFCFILFFNFLEKEIQTLLSIYSCFQKHKQSLLLTEHWNLLSEFSANGRCFSQSTELLCVGGHSQRHIMPRIHWRKIHCSEVENVNHHTHVEDWWATLHNGNLMSRS